MLEPDILNEAEEEEQLMGEDESSTEKKETKISIKLDNKADNASLEFFTNPVYLGRINRKKFNDTSKEDNKSDIKFYRKRIVSLFKELMKEDCMSREVKEAHDIFIIKAINYFQVMDTKDIIQGQYLQEQEQESSNEAQEQHKKAEAEADTDVIGTAPPEGGVGLALDSPTEQAGHHLFMMRKTCNVANLDNYVIAKHDMSCNELKIIPMKINIDLKSAELKTKGLKPKIKKQKT